MLKKSVEELQAQVHADPIVPEDAGDVQDDSFLLVEIGCQTDPWIPTTTSCSNCSTVKCMKDAYLSTDDLHIKAGIENDHIYFGRVFPDPRDVPLHIPVCISPESQSETYCANPPLELLDVSDETESSDESGDPDYIPENSDSSEDELENEDEINTENDSVHDLYVVFKNQLLDLFKVCHNEGCGKFIIGSPKIRTCGFAMTITTECGEGHTYRWASQPMLGGTYAGNLLIPSALFLTGASYLTFNEACTSIDLATLTDRQCTTLQSIYMVPEVERMWQQHTESLLAAAGQTPLTVSGDARCDSPGHCATYGTYSILDTTSHLILAQETVRVTDENVANSYWLEPEGLERCIKSLEDHGCKVKTLATDRHPSINKMMRETYSHIEHEFDLWHIVKGMKKKLLSNKNPELLPWVRTISNHLWYSAAFCNGDAVKLKESWLGMLHHITNEHQWISGETVVKCDHAPYSAEEAAKRPWLSQDSKALQLLRAIALDKRLLKDLERVTKCVHTGELESIHSLYTKYVPKRKKFTKSGMVARLRVAALDHNTTVGREQAQTREGLLRYKLEYSKSAGKYVTKPIKIEKDWSFRKQLINGISDRCSKGPSQRKLLLRRKKNVDKSLGENAGLDKPEKAMSVAAHVTRMNRS
jgi:hypothetical protein